MSGFGAPVDSWMNGVGKGGLLEDEWKCCAYHEVSVSAVAGKAHEVAGNTAMQWNELLSSLYSASARGGEGAASQCSSRSYSRYLCIRHPDQVRPQEGLL